MTSQNSFRIVAAVLGMAALIGFPARMAAADSGRQYYELRVYNTQSEAQRQQVSDYWQHAAVPAYNALGIRSIGVFTEQQDSPTNKIYVLIPFNSLDEFAAIPAKLAANAGYQKAAADYLARTKANAAFNGFESSVLVAFEGMKRMAVPATDKRPEVFELRTYLSPSEGKGDNKVQMFNDGEITVMQEVGLSPIFFAQVLSGPHMPALIYMTSGENMEEHRKHWQAFGVAPGWDRLKNDPKYKDNMTGMIRVLLKRTPASQI
jgi:hypothetical protein